MHMDNHRRAVVIISTRILQRKNLHQYLWIPGTPFKQDDQEVPECRVCWRPAEVLTDWHLLEVVKKLGEIEHLQQKLKNIYQEKLLLNSYHLMLQLEGIKYVIIRVVIYLNFRSQRMILNLNILNHQLLKNKQFNRQQSYITQTQIRFLQLI